MTNEAKPSRNIPLDVYLTSNDMGRQKPSTEMEALMMSPPGVEPVESIEELQPLREVVAQCIDLLNEQDQYVINALNSERVTLQELGDRLGVSRMHASRLRDAAFSRLKKIMEMHPIIRRRVMVADTWEQSALQWVTHIASLADEPQEINTELLEVLVDKAWAHVPDWKDSPSVTFWISMACAAVREMRLRSQWDSGEMVSTLVRKQLAYGHGNINKFGVSAIIVRLSDKVQRLKNLQQKQESPDWEPLVDTMLDIVGYCVIGLMYDDETFQLEVGDEYVK
jgi:hypothetical protein